eukprot:2795592-Rhodomonas_salina.1
MSPPLEIAFEYESRERMRITETTPAVPRDAPSPSTVHSGAKGMPGSTVTFAGLPIKCTPPLVTCTT